MSRSIGPRRTRFLTVALLAGAIGWAWLAGASVGHAQSGQPDQPSPTPLPDPVTPAVPQDAPAVLFSDGAVPLVTSFHVHSTASTGDLTLDQLATQAEDLGIEAIVLTENFVLQYEYGLFPWRSVIKAKVSFPSVLDYGVERYFAEVADVQARHPKVLLVPGMEITPHYYWTGSLFSGDLTMFNGQKNILVFGLPGPSDYLTLPVNGNPGSYRFDAGLLVQALPVALLIPAVWCWRRRDDGRRRALWAGLLAALAGLLLFNARPYGDPQFAIYDAGLRYRPYQTLIERVEALGGVTIWSMPEAKDFHEYGLGPFGVLTIKTNPYPEALQLTRGYTAFGSIYQDTRTVTQPGGIWDELLTLPDRYRKGLPPWGVGEIAFHGLNRDTRELDQVLTVFGVRQRTAAGIVEALKTGRSYAVGQYRSKTRLRLEEFRVGCHAEDPGATSGETLTPAPSCAVTVSVRVSAADPPPMPVTVTVVRSGQVMGKASGPLPFVQRFVDPTPSADARGVYRVIVEGQEVELLSNPIFVEPIPAGTDAVPASPGDAADPGPPPPSDEVRS